MEEFTFDTRVAFLSLFRSRLSWIFCVTKLAEAFLIKFHLMRYFINPSTSLSKHNFMASAIIFQALHANSPSTPCHQDGKRAP